MPILSSAEIKAQLLREDIARPVPEDFEAKKEAYKEIGQAVERMSGTTGWGIVRAWLLRHLDITTILKSRGEDRDRQLIKAEAYADLLQVVENWIVWSKKIDVQEKKEE